MDSIAFARDQKPNSPQMKTEDPLPSGTLGDNLSTTSWLPGIKQKLYDMFSMSNSTSLCLLND
jgi:hypothetical protein